jgi:hypothetical protein
MDYMVYAYLQTASDGEARGGRARAAPEDGSAGLHRPVWKVAHPVDI